MYLDTGNKKQDTKREVKKRKIMTREPVGWVWEEWKMQKF